MISVQKLPILEPEMREALRQHILRKRQRLKQEIEQEAIEKRLKREKELKQVHDAMTLDQIREQLTALESKMTDLREEKHNLFVQLKQVLSEDSSRKKQVGLESLKRQQVSTDDTAIIPEPKPTAANQSIQSSSLKSSTSSSSISSSYKPHLLAQSTVQQQPVSARFTSPKDVVKPVQQVIRPIRAGAQEPLQMPPIQSTLDLKMLSQPKQSQNMMQQQLQSLNPVINHQQLPSPQTNSSLLTTITSFAQNNQVAHSANISRKNLNRSYKTEGLVEFKGSLAASSGDPQANSPIDFTQSKIPAHVVSHLGQSSYPFHIDTAQNLVTRGQDIRISSSTKRPYNSIVTREPILDARKRPPGNSHPSYNTNPSTNLLNGLAQSGMPGVPDISQYRSITSHANCSQNPLISTVFAHKTDFSQANNFKPNPVYHGDSYEMNSTQGISHLASFYPNLQTTHLNYRPNFPVSSEDDLRHFAMPYPPMSQNFTNPISQINLSLPPAPSPYMASFNYSRKPFNSTYPFHQNK